MDRTVPWLIVFFAVPFIGIGVLGKFFPKVSIAIFFASTEKRTQLNVLILPSYQIDAESGLFHGFSLLYQ